MPVVELTISPGYVPKWSTWQALRELVQNCVDADEKGFVASIGRGLDKIISIANDGVVLQRSDLLLGSTTKADDPSQRGQFGEGLKLSLLVLLRQGYDVEIKNGSEIWRPTIEYSETFGTDLLTVHIEETTEFSWFTVYVTGVDDEDWQSTQDRILWLKPPAPDEALAVGNDKILRGRYANQLYVRNLYVTDMADHCDYGYDLSEVELDRDRQLTDPWSLRQAISNCLRQGVAADALDARDVVKLLQSDCGEAVALGQRYQYGSSDVLSQAVKTLFIEVYGEDAVPVCNEAEANEAAHHALKPVIVSRPLRVVLELELGSLAKRLGQRKLQIVKRHNLADLTMEELTNFRWASCLAAEVYDKFQLNNVEVVDFSGGTTICGLFYSGTISLSRHILCNRQELMATIIHEAAHNFGADGSVNHHHAMERMFSSLIASYVR